MPTRRNINNCKYKKTKKDKKTKKQASKTNKQKKKLNDTMQEANVWP